MTNANFETAWWMRALATMGSGAPTAPRDSAERADRHATGRQAEARRSTLAPLGEGASRGRIDLRDRPTERRPVWNHVDWPRDPIRLLSDEERGMPDISEGEGQPTEMAQRVARMARQHLAMDVAWVAEFFGSHLVCRAVDGDGEAFGVEVGGRWWLDEGQRLRVLAGQVSAVVPDTAAEEAPRCLFAPDRGSIRAYVTVPILLPSGGVYGVLCCASSMARPGALAEHDVHVLEALAEIVAGQQERAGCRVDPGPEAELVRQVLQRGGPRMVFQPMVDLRSGRLTGVEALARFPGAPYEAPDVWFDRAARAGLAIDLQRLAVRRALDARHRLPDGVAMHVNASPDFVVSGSLEAELLGAEALPVVVELTEHRAVADYDELRGALEELRSTGVQLAVDGAGVGLGGFRHLVELEPDVIKLDPELTGRVGEDRMRDALTAALTTFAAEMGATVCAVGIEDPTTLHALRMLAVDQGQGFVFARPGDLPLARTEFVVT